MTPVGNESLVRLDSLSRRERARVRGSDDGLVEMFRDAGETRSTRPVFHFLTLTLSRRERETVQRLVLLVSEGLR
jgi:hypothetical protein